MPLQEKADQVLPLLKETALDCWLIFVRETGLHPDPGFELVVGADVVRNSAFLFGSGSQRIAITARFDTTSIRNTGVFAEVVGYDEDVRAPLLDALARLDPQSIGLNYSPDDVTADGLTYGQWLLLQDLLRGTPYADRLTSAAPLLSRLRGRKSPTEVERIRRAVEVTEEIVELLTAQIRPGASERQLADRVHSEFRRRGLEPAWGWDGCPIVNAAWSRPGAGTAVRSSTSGPFPTGPCQSARRPARRAGSTDPPRPGREVAGLLLRPAADVVRPPRRRVGAA
jgi:Xaa-Pro aminopeptidase